MRIDNPKHQTYIINLEKRTDRKLNIEKEFSAHQEFEITIFKAVERQRGALGLFQSFQKIVELAVEKELDYVIICEDDHVFTSNYNKHLLNAQIKLGQELEFDALLGGMSNVHDALFFNPNLVWVGGFTGLQFTVVFKKFYAQILPFTLGQKPFDLELAYLSDHIYCCYPTISTQRSYGYSDATTENNDMQVESYFETCNQKLDRLYKISQYFDLVNY
ncbi:hypothetical protein [Pedobacter sp. Hv1]|uniref:hypothetical protein n=1 Tax=Pedobacter sp. Hv1 TaxID=1740090 RepID=UPI0006D8B5DC|nr:hypothetical protein [Pedobacter sp. Hv1]KQB98618.1 hypothetical protein AQF98_21500 [Pedobacter sp. Hv1]